MMATKLPKLWATSMLDSSREISNAGAFMMMALDDVGRCHNIDVGLVTAVWRRYCAANLTEQEWQRAAFNRQDADKHAARALRELTQALHVADHGRVTPTAHHLLAGLRERFLPSMAVNEFVAYCQNTYESLTGRFAK